MASPPSPASPTTSISYSSSSMRRKPRRTRLWSSTSNTVIFFAIRLYFLPWNLQVHQGSAFRWTRNNNLSAHQLGTLTHRDQTDPTLVCALREPNSMIFHVQLKNI